jgi:hypothetical protein
MPHDAIQLLPPRIPYLAAAHPPIWPAWVAWLVVIGLAAAITGIWIWRRRAALRTWQRYARQHVTGGEFRARDAFAPACVTGTVRNRPVLLETATSNEDDAPYYHTRGALPIRNNAGFILGVRRKSLLEEVQTRRDQRPFDLDDPDFEGRFFVVCNQGESLAAVLTPEVRRELKRYHDVEVYVRLSQMEWRRAGEENDLPTLQRLMEMLADMAEEIERLPSQPATLSQRLADENLIAKGV